MPYTVTPTALPEVMILEPKVFGDARGFSKGTAFKGRKKTADQVPIEILHLFPIYSFLNTIHQYFDIFNP